MVISPVRCIIRIAVFTMLVLGSVSSVSAKDKEYYVQDLDIKYESTLEFEDTAVQDFMNVEQEDPLNERSFLDFTCKESTDGKWHIRVHKRGKIKRTYSLKKGRRKCPCTIEETGVCYVTVSNLFAQVPEKIRAMLKNYKLHSDPDADQLLTISRKKRKITIRELSPDIYKYLGAFAYNALGVENNKLFVKVFNNERAKVFFIKDADRTTRKDYFIRAFFLYCLNNKRLKMEAPQTYSFLERIMKLNQ